MVQVGKDDEKGESEDGLLWTSTLKSTRSARIVRRIVTVGPVAIEWRVGGPSGRAAPTASSTDDAAASAAAVLFIISTSSSARSSHTRASTTSYFVSAKTRRTGRTVLYLLQPADCGFF